MSAVHPTSKGCHAGGCYIDVPSVLGEINFTVTKPSTQDNLHYCTEMLGTPIIPITNRLSGCILPI